MFKFIYLLHVGNDDGSMQDLLPELERIQGGVNDSEGSYSGREDLRSDGEASIEEPGIMDCTADESQPTISFEIIEDSSKRGKSKLTDSRGYTYNVKRKRVNATDWQCTVRPKVNTIQFLKQKNLHGEMYSILHKVPERYILLILICIFLIL